MPAAQAKLNFGELLDSAQKGPVTITKKGRPVAVLLSTEEFARFEAMEDANWAARAEARIAEGDWIGSEESTKLINEALKIAKD
jgi:prevent-host-death family protein